MLASKFSPDSQFAPPTEIEPGILFLDGNPATFDLILDYLRNGCRMVTRPPSHLLSLFRIEADYFGLVKLVKACDSPAARSSSYASTMSDKSTMDELLRRSVGGKDDILRLSVGGQLFATTRATLCTEKGSMLASTFILRSIWPQPTEIEPGILFLDRNPATFDLILDYLRNGCHMMIIPPSHLLPLLRIEAHHFGLAKLLAACNSPAATRPRVEYKTLEIGTGMVEDMLPKLAKAGWTIKHVFKNPAYSEQTFLLERENYTVMPHAEPLWG